MEHIIQKFIDETYELLEELESSLLVLEEIPDDEANIGSVFRCLHTIKGSAAMFGFNFISTFTHHIEDVYELVRSDKLEVNRELIDATLAAKDCILEMLENADKDWQQDARIVAIMAGFKEMLSLEPVEAKLSAGDKAESLPEENQPAVYLVFFKPHPDIFSYGTNPAFLLDELRELGESSMIAQTGLVPALSEIEPDACYIHWDIFITTTKGIDAIRDVFIFVEDNCDIEIKEIQVAEPFDTAGAHKKLGEILVERGYTDAESIRNVLKNRKKIGETLVENELVSKEKVNSALSEQRHMNELRKNRAGKQQVNSLRVPLTKLDNLVNMVGELVTSGARLNELGNANADPELRALAEEMDRLIGELRDSAMNIRMMPIGTLFSKFNRLVRDLSRDLDKNITFTTSGEETELDKTVLEQLNDPLVHLIRNCIDHGIEQPDSRQEKGKPVEGNVRLSAAHAGAHVVIKIEDDGAGMNKDAIHAKGVERGLITEDADLTDQEIYALIFQAGFSTAASVTNVSGRGVGLDVVKTAIEKLRGTIEIRSQKDHGTTFTIKLPLTLAIIDGLHVQVARENYIIPLSSVEECFEINNRQSRNTSDRRLIELRGEMLPYISLREFFHIEGERPVYEQIVVANINNTRTGIKVDNIIGQYQTVIKTLGKVYEGVEGLSGATILGNGRVALILDVNKLEELVVKTESEYLRQRNRKLNMV